MQGYTALLIITIASALIAVVLFVYAIVAFRRGRVWGGVSRLLTCVVLLALAALAATFSLATQGYRALTRETLAARITVDELGPQRFRATFTFPDGRTERFELAGDQLYVDAHILKWHPWANFIGLHTAYELDRVAGRYMLLDDEQTRPRTVHSLKADKPLDMFALTRRYQPLELLLDAEYGSATFVPIEDGAEFNVLVSTTGLLARPAD